MAVNPSLLGSFYDYWSGHNIVGWTYDDVDFLRSIIGEADFDDNLRSYATGAYDRRIRGIIESSGITFNLGGKEEKVKLVSTDKPQGVFDFSLASKGLYRVPEYYSKELADEQPNLFKEFGLPSGVVPPNFVRTQYVLGNRKFVFIDQSGKEYVCKQFQKGTIEIRNGIKGAKLKFATTTKKVYLKFLKSGGKVNYVEIYSLFYYTSLYGETSYAVRHLPALMCAKYFEERGIKVRYYPTRFVMMGRELPRQNDVLTNANLPLYEEQNQLGNIPTNRSRMGRRNLVIQPFLMKDYGEEIDFAKCLTPSASNVGVIYRNGIQYAQYRDLVDNNQTNYPTGGDPDWNNEQYREGFERYKNKNKIYVERGIWKNKEIMSDTQIMFHSMSIKRLFEDVKSRINIITGEDELKDQMAKSRIWSLLFEWWMKLISFAMRDYISLLATKQPVKEMEKMAKEMQEHLDLFQNLIHNTNFSSIEDKSVKDLLMNYVKDICEEENIPISYSYDISTLRVNTIKLKARTYINILITNSTIFAEGGVFATPPEEIERRQLIAAQLEDSLAKTKL